MTYQLLLTTLGQDKIAAAANAGSPSFGINEFVVGQGVDVDFSQRLDKQVLVSKRYQGSVESVSSTAIAGQYEITCIVPIDKGGWTIREFGLIDNDGDLIWVGQLPNVEKPPVNSTAAVDYRIKAVIQIDNPDVSVIIDGNVVTATQTWVSNNFVSNPRFANFLELAYPYGYPYWTHSKTNPKPLFDAMFGFATHWRRLEGIGMVAVKDGDAYIGQPMLNLGQRGTTELATSVRPHTYPVYTSYLFERYDPDTVVSTVWKVIANKSSIDEGGAVRFTVTANNLPDGQVLNWAIKEGQLNTANNDITSPDNTTTGNATLSNGQAIINYTTTPDDNIDEPQKHVRITISSPASLSLNVPIDDSGFNETVVHISQSTTDGINLAEYYQAQSGQLPSSSDTVRFIVDAGVDIIAPDTATPAITEGNTWPNGTDIIIENRGRILGRGGDGGRSAYYAGQFRDGDTRPTSADIVPAVPGQNGGLAVLSESTSISIENYGVISGGGGGGGGMGAWIYVNTNAQASNSPSVTAGGGGGSGGGAPFGKRSPNEGTWQMYLKDPAAKIPRFDLPDNTRLYHYFTLLASQAQIQGSGIQNELHGHATPASQHRNVYLPIKPDYSANYFTDFDGEYRTTGCSTTSEVGMSAPLMMSQNATVEVAGKGGYGGGDASGSYFMQLSKGADLSVNHGGAGGGFGDNGEFGVIGSIYTATDAGVSTTTKPQVNFYSESAEGGLAGYIKEGNVTINNLSSGTTKGR